MNNPFEYLDERLTIIESLLRDLQKNRQQISDSIDSEKLLTIKDAAKLLFLSVPTIYGMVQRAEIPYSKRGKRLYFSDTDLIAWIKEGRRKTTSEIFDQAYKNLKRRGA